MTAPPTVAGAAPDAGGPAPSTLPALLAAVAGRFPGHEALISTRGRLRFDALAVLAARVACALAARGVGKGARVGLLLPNVPEWLAIAFGVWQCGGVVVPLSTLYRPRELAHALALADVGSLIAIRRFLAHDYVAALETIAAGASAARAPLFAPALPSLRDVIWLDPPPPETPLDLGPLFDAGGAPDLSWAAALAATVSPLDPATIMFTSGSTAEPKGVVHTQRALVTGALEDAAVLGLDAADRTWGYLPFFFAGGLVAVALATLSRGGGVVLQEVFEPGETLRLLSTERVTVFFAWPHQAEAIVSHPAFATTRLALRKGVGANAKWAAAIYPPDHTAVPSYGMTETPPICTAWPWDAPLALRQSSHGPPVGAKELRIVDPESGRVLTAGREGEICVRGPSMMSGYYKQEPESCFDRDGFFHTGDLGSLDERGALHFIGRIKDVIKTAGANVAAAEVESVLASHPAVGAAYAVGVDDALRGENVAAFVVPTRDVSVDDLLRHCREHLASYKVPRHLWLLAEDALPQKSSGKVDKAALRSEGARLRAGSDRS